MASVHCTGTQMLQYIYCTWSFYQLSAGAATGVRRSDGGARGARGPRMAVQARRAEGAGRRPHRGRTGGRGERRRGWGAGGAVYILYRWIVARVQVIIRSFGDVYRPNQQTSTDHTAIMTHRTSADFCRRLETASDVHMVHRITQQTTDVFRRLQTSSNVLHDLHTAQAPFSLHTAQADFDPVVTLFLSSALGVSGLPLLPLAHHRAADQLVLGTCTSRSASTSV